MVHGDGHGGHGGVAHRLAVTVLAKLSAMLDSGAHPVAALMSLALWCTAQTRDETGDEIAVAGSIPRNRRRGLPDEAKNLPQVRPGKGPGSSPSPRPSARGKDTGRAQGPREPG